MEDTQVWAMEDYTKCELWRWAMEDTPSVSYGGELWKIHKCELWKTTPSVSYGGELWKTTPSVS